MEILLFLVNEIVLYNIYTYMYIYAYMQKEKLLIRESSKAWKFQTSASSFQRGFQEVRHQVFLCHHVLLVA